MKIVKINSTGGASGDMLLGALAGLGLDTIELNTELASLLPEENFTVEVERITRKGFAGNRLEVNCREESHHHRHFPMICDIINNSGLPETVKTNAVKVFKVLGEAEAKVHGTTLDKIHFHEVGAVDSIVDIAGTCLALHKLGADGFCLSGSLPIGTGTMKCAHGIMPIPAPATAELLKGMPIVQTDEPFEMVTPTGAALLKALAVTMPPETGTIAASSYSFGKRELNNRPNMLRAVLFTGSEIPSGNNDTCIKLECNLDDCSPEIIGAMFDTLLDAGALDVFATPVQMKKQRPGVLLSVLCAADRQAELEEIIFRETGTFGIRESHHNRRILDREFREIETPWGKVQLKVGSLNGKVISYAPEFEDCRKLAEKNNVSIKTIYNIVLKSVAE